jgi:hypothetical protein
MNSASIIRLCFVGMLAIGGFSLVGKASTYTPRQTVKIEAAPSNVGPCQLGHSC